ncbi:RhoGAP-domain-containing protein [Pisolithus thermaeus]|nr:RhoGAP-domain-containing protein [Pisolithus thermaeus]
MPITDLVQVNPLNAIENRLCPGCKQSAVNETGGLVVAFGQSFFHVDCFKCAKCNQQVTADTNLLLLSDGSPICANCSYNCNICQQPILDEAIMTGDDSYHAHCFKCKVCRNRIDELVFAKTSQGIYCMACHNERMAKIRRHAQRKREKEKAASGSGSSSTRERDARGHLTDYAGSDRSRDTQSSRTSLRSKASTSTFRETRSTNSVEPSTPAKKRKSLPPADNTPTATRSGTSSAASSGDPRRDHIVQSHFSSSDTAPSQAFSMTIAPPEMSNSNVDEHGVLVNGHSSVSHSHSLNPTDSRTSFGHLQAPPSGGSTIEKSYLSPLSAGGSKNVQRRKSYDDGVRPLNFLFGKKSSNHDAKNPIDKSQNSGLSVPNGGTNGGEKRRSTNPGLAITTGMAPEMVRSHTVPVQVVNSPVTPSPSRPLFDASSRRASNNSSLRDTASISTVYHSPSSSPTPTDSGRGTPDSVRMRTISHDPQSAPPSARPGTPLRNALHPDGAVRTDGFGNVSRSLDSSNSYSANGRLSPIGPSGGRPARSDGASSGLSSPLSWVDRSGVVPPASPSHVADVPHSVESGTDTEAETDYERNPDATPAPTSKSPPVPPKEFKSKPRPSNLNLEDVGTDPDVSVVSQLDGSEESSPVERTSVATFIAPALPPIRFSMSGSDFSDFLKSVGGIPPLKSLDQISEGARDGAENVSLANDSTAAHSDHQTGAGQSTPSQHPTQPVNFSDMKSEALPTVPPETKDEPELRNVVPTTAHEFPSRDPAAPESLSPSLTSDPGASERKRLNSNASLNVLSSTARITLITPESTTPTPVSSESYEVVLRRLQESLMDANEKGSSQVRFNKSFLETITSAMEQRHAEYNDLKSHYDGTKRASQQYMHGLTVAQKEYDRELVARRNAEAEIIRLRVLLSGQAAKLTALSSENKRVEGRKKLSEELTKDLIHLGKDFSRLKVERDLALAEMEELYSSKSAAASGEVPVTHIRSLVMRLDSLKSQYKHELIPLSEQRECLMREISELRASRDQFLEETTVLNARNEELAQLSTQYARRAEVARPETPVLDISPPPMPDDTNKLRRKKSMSLDRLRHAPETLPSVQHSLSASSTQSTNAVVEDREKGSRTPKPDQSDAISTLRSGKFKWPGSRTREPATYASDHRGKMHMEHNFQQASTLRFARCDHCGDKLWGTSQLRCSNCHISVHSRCMNQVQLLCTHQPRHRDDVNGHVVALPTMFGRDLVEQVKSDCRWGERKVPVIVEKCIEAVEAVALDYEGIYRKTGGYGQTKIITQLFERQDYTTFDLRDTDRFNDICSVTSVLKTYFRSLPVPLLTFDLHEEFISAAGLKDPALKTKHLQELVDRLPSEHYHTLRLLVLHLHRVREHSDQNLMTARNLGVVFGPTLMWSRDPGSEFSDMAGKALMVEWLVDNAVTIFSPQP